MAKSSKSTKAQDWQFTAWLGLNAAGESEFAKQFSEITRISPAIGLGVWFRQPWLLREKLELGVLIGFQRIFAGETSDRTKVKFSIIPIIAELKFLPSYWVPTRNIFGALGIGYAHGFLVIHDQSLGTATMVLSARVGYERPWTHGLSFNLILQSLWLLQTLVINQTGEISNSQMNLGVNARVSYRAP